MSANRNSEVDKLLQVLDGRGSDSEFTAIQALASREALPELLLLVYRSAKAWGVRASCVYHAIHYAANNESAFTLGLEGATDRSRVVRYRACMLLAVAQRSEAIPTLVKAAELPGTSEDATAAIDAIRSGNHNFFVDRDHSGKVKLSFGGTS